jgi:hypothetical protein
MNKAKCRIFSLFLFAMADSQVLAQQQDEPIRNSCTSQEYDAYLQDFIGLQQSLADSRPGEIPLNTLLNGDGHRQVSPQCLKAISSLQAVNPPGRRCTRQQRQEMIAGNRAAQWPQALRTDCWNF